MPNIATVLKLEIARVARKELRSQTEALKKTAATLRSELASLKRRTADLEQQLRKVSKGVPKARPSDEAASTENGKFRFTAKGLASNRRRLGLSAADFGLLVGATGQSIYAWEGGETKPRAKSLAAIAALRSIGKKEAAARLAELRVSG